jgi:subfamily B ATP-binding cassette protein MsbA
MVIFSLFCTLGVSACTLCTPWLIKVLLQEALIRKDEETLYLCIGAAAVVATTLALSRWGYEFFTNSFCQKLIYELRNKVFDKVLSLPLLYLHSKRRGEIISHLTYDLQTLERVLPGIVFGFLKDPFILLGGVFLLFYIEWRLALVVMLVAPTILSLIKKMAKRMKHLSERVQEKMADVITVMEESIQGIQTLKIFSQEERRRRYFHKQNLSYLQFFLSAAKTLFASSPLAEFLCTLGILFVIWYGGHLVIGGQLLPSELIAFILYITTISLPARNLAKLSLSLQQMHAATERVFTVLEEKEEGVDGRRLVLPKIKGAIKIEDLHFGYEKECVLKGIYMQIEPGEVVAIVGPNGAGKTTLAALLLKFYKPSSGKILIDGYNINDVDTRSLRAQVVAVWQQSMIFSTTLLENILMGEENVDWDRFKEIVRLCKVEDFAASLPSGYNTLIGDGGLKLSEGQAQRVAIARALIREPRVLILDEATAFLDPESEAFIRDGMEQILRGQTTIIIAQRLSMATVADRIFVMDKGRIVEEGEHKDLMKRGGLYRKLYKYYRG